MTIIEALKIFRDYKKINAEKLSTKLGFHKSYIYKVENGLVQPSKEKLLAIFKGLDLPDELINLLVLDSDKLEDQKKAFYGEIHGLILSFIVDITTNPVLKKEIENQKLEIKHYTLIMKGGGVKGLAYIGALEELTKHFSFNWYSGTSAGGISAVLLGGGYSVSELKEILINKNFKDFLDSNIFNALYNLFSKGGLYKANKFTEWISNLLAQKLASPTEIELGQLPFRTTLYACKRGTSALIFDSTDARKKETSAAFATRCTMSIPLVFIPQKDQGLNVCDGGLRNNFPVSQILNDNPGTDFIGLYLGNPIFDGKVKSNSVISDVLSIWSESSDHEALKKYEDNIVVIDPHPIRTIDFWLTSEEKEMLLESGKFHALRFLKKNKIGSISKKVIEDVEKSFLSKKESVIQTRKNKRKKVLVVIVIIVFCFQLL